MINCSKESDLGIIIIGVVESELMHALAPTVRLRVNVDCFSVQFLVESRNQNGSDLNVHNLHYSLVEIVYISCIR